MKNKNKNLINVFQPLRSEILDYYLFFEKDNIEKDLTTANLKNKLYKKASTIEDSFALAGILKKL